MLCLRAKIRIYSILMHKIWNHHESCDCWYLNYCCLYCACFDFLNIPKKASIISLSWWRTFRVCRLGLTIPYIRRGGVVAPRGHCGSFISHRLLGIIPY